MVTIAMLKEKYYYGMQGHLKMLDSRRPQERYITPQTQQGMEGRNARKKLVTGSPLQKKMGVSSRGGYTYTHAIER